MATTRITSLIAGYDALVVDMTGWTEKSALEIIDAEHVATVLQFPTEHLFNLDFLTDQIKPQSLKAWKIMSDGGRLPVDCVHCQSGSNNRITMEYAYETCPGPKVGIYPDVNSNECRLKQMK